MHERNIKVSGVELPIEELHFSFIVNKLRTEYGFLESSRNGVPMTKDGQVLPLYTYPCIEWIDSMDFTGCNIFEFGVGFSSLFWSQINCANVYGGEKKEDWFERIGSVNDIEVYHEQESKNFIEAVHRPNIKFDVYGVNNVQPVWADNYFKAISNSKMGLNLSRGDPIKYYSSDRITQIIGNGLVTLIDEKTHYRDFFNDQEMVFYKNVSDLAEKIIKISKDEKLRKKI